MRPTESRLFDNYVVSLVRHELLSTKLDPGHPVMVAEEAILSRSLMALRTYVSLTCDALDVEARLSQLVRIRMSSYGESDGLDEEDLESALGRILGRGFADVTRPDPARRT